MSCRAHGVTQAGSNTYAYDANGNMTSGAGRTLTWNSANLATQITQSGAGSTFSYGPDGSRWKQVKTNASGAVSTVRYLGAGYEEVVAGGVTEKKHYIFAGDERIAIYATKTTGSSSLKYLHQDHLGSTDAVTDAAGTVIERLSYDPHGKRRNANWTGAAGILASVSTDRGFTDHEHLDEVGLIHMNGRIYDPTLGRFLSADPTVQFPEASQSLNRYSYVLNNPLSFTDPTGYGIGSVFKSIGRAFKSVFKAIGKLFKNPYVRLAIGIAAGFYGGQAIALRALGAAAKGGFAFGVVAGASGGFIAGAIIGGTPEAAFYGGVTGGIFGAIGGLNLQFPGNVFAHALAGGTTSRMQGGAFKSGMLSAGFAEWASPLVGEVAKGTAFLDRAAWVTASAIIGGTAAAVGGGKFENGAASAAFAQTFNGELHREDANPQDSVLSPLTDRADDAVAYWIDQDIPFVSPAMGTFAMLVTDEYVVSTLLTIVPGGGLLRWSARPFWQYYPAGAVNYGGKYLTRGWGWRPPYATSSDAASGLSLPHYNPGTAVRAVHPRGFVRGPSTVKPDYGHPGGGREYTGGKW